ncbi:MAG: LexA family protein [Candidatus Fimenecus sp.]
MTIYDKIKYLREKQGLSQQELAEKVGFKTASAVNKIELGLRDINQTKILAFSKALGTTPGYLLSDNDEEESLNYENFPNALPLPKTVKRPRLGTIACGEPILTEENFEGYDDVPENIKCDFTLQCQGDSMINARINDGDIVYIKCQPTVENGQIAAVMVNNETTLKRVFLYQDKVILQAENPKYEPWVYVGEELNSIRILGKAVGFFSYLK